MNGFRQLNEAEEVEVEFKITDGGLLEAVKVTGPNGEDCRGSSKHPPKRVFRKIRCYNCGEFKNHVGKFIFYSNKWNGRRFSLLIVNIIIQT